MCIKDGAKFLRRFYLVTLYKYLYLTQHHRTHMKVRADKGLFLAFCKDHANIRTVTEWRPDGFKLETHEAVFTEGNKMEWEPNGFFVDVTLIGTQDFKQSAKALMQKYGILVPNDYLAFLHN